MVRWSIVSGTKPGLMFLFFSVFSFLFCFLCSVFLWVNCSVFLGFLLLSGAVNCFISGFLSLSLGVLLPFINFPADCLSSVLPLQDCYLPRTRSWARDVVLDWIESVADFQPVESGWRRRTRLFYPQRRRFGSNGFHQQRRRFKQQWTFLFWSLNFGNSAIGPLEIKNSI